MNEEQLRLAVEAAIAHALPKKMTLKAAVSLIEAVERKASEMGLSVVVAVSCASGRPIAVHCMDGAYIGSFDIALNKTYSAAAFQMPTAKLGQLARPDGPLYGIQSTNDGKVVIIGGGEPLYDKGVLVGALGVSGASLEEDTFLGEYGKTVWEEVMACR